RNLLKMRLLQRVQQRATHAREQVLSVVAHDLRSPLASIVMDMEMLSHLLSEDEHAVQSRIVHRIERTAQRMHNLVEDLLEVSRLEHGTFAVRAQQVAPLAVFGEAESMLRPLAQARAIDLSFDGPSELPDVRADVERMLQVFSNLIGNALQFTGEGGHVRVSWRIEASEVVVTVADSGAGIPPELLPYAFDAFWQGNMSARKGGVGLGLAITRAIIEAQGGRIWIASIVGSGTTVHFTIPVASSAVSPRIAAL
ncbi:MAG: sensor histidine kinase, partial [Longimicrobiales bacterium]